MRPGGIVSCMTGDTPCVLHSGTRNEGGYGMLAQPVHGSRLAHRAVLAQHLGRPVEGFALHTCDNPPCINPEHLYEGTQADNMRDASQRGRARGRFSYATTCVHGHLLSGKNLILKKNSKVRSGIERVCAVCRRRRHQEQAERRKALRAERQKNG